MSYNYVNVTLTPGQIKKLQTGHAASTGVSVTLKHNQLAGGPNKIPLTKTQLNHLNKARASSKGVKKDFSAAAIKDMVKFGGIFPFLAAIPALIAAAVPAVAKAAALGAVETAAGMALKKATGQGYKKRGRSAKGGDLSELLPVLRERISPVFRNALRAAAAGVLSRKLTGQGYKKRGSGLRLPGTPPQWYPR